MGPASITPPFCVSVNKGWGIKRSRDSPSCREPPPFSYGTEHSRPIFCMSSTEMRFGTFQLLFLIHTTLHKNAGTLTGGEMGMQCLNGVLSLDGTLSTKRKELRTQFFIFACAGWSAVLFSLGMTSEAQLRNPIFFVGTLVILIGLSIAICAVLCRVPLTTSVVVGTLYMITCGILMWDLAGRAFSMEQWVFLVLIIDMLLVMQVPKVYSLGLVCFVLI